MTDVVSVVVAKELRGEVEKMLAEDDKMVGIARYLAKIKIFWSTDIDTACAGSGYIFFNQDFWNELPEATRNTVIAHEVWHLILKHMERSVGFDPEDYNIAGDHVINNLLEIEGFTFEFPHDMDFEPCKDAKYIGMSTEEVYNIIHKERKKKQQDPDNKCKKSDHVPKSKIEDLVKAAADLIEGNDDYSNVSNQIEKNKKDLEDLKKSLGGNSGYTHIKLEITDGKVAIRNASYEEIFEKYLIDPISGAKRSFMRPNRRMHGVTGFQLPGRVVRDHKSNRLAHLIYALDVSGSITHRQAQIFHNSVKTIKELLNPNLLTVLFFDTKIVLTKTFTAQEPYLKIKVQAGGSTCLNEVYEYAVNRRPEAMVIFTDLAVTIPPEPKWETIWLVPALHRESNVANLYGNIYIIE